ncbi:MAG TPA: hypothetical protein VFB08_03490, partial [Burkholderiales bacterium]|nr:hypothetical protein [Burkholderiales bacterium]
MLASEPGRVRLAALRIFDFLSERPAVAVCAGLVLVAAIAAADYATGYEIRLAVLYLIPIGIVTWQAGWQRGSAIAVLASLTWFLSFERS